MFHGENCHGLFQTWEIGRYAGNVCEKWKTDEFQEEQMDFLSSNSFLMMEKSMMFLWTKQAAILDNIANAETPGYKAKIVTFEETLKARLEEARHSSAPKSAVEAVLNGSDAAVVEQMVSTRMDENGVNVTEQSTEMIRNAYQLQYVMSAMNSDLSTLRTAIQG